METPAPAAPARFRLPELPPLLLAAAPFLDPRTWGAVAHVWAGFPLGLLWFVGMTVGFLAGLPLTIVWIGFPLLALTLAAVWAAEGLERRLAIYLLGAQVPERRVPAAAGTGESLLQWAGSVVASPALWKGMLFLFLRFPLGLAGWIFSLVSLTVSAVFLAAPWIELFGWGDIHLLYFDVEGAWKLWTVAALGILMTIATLHLHRALGWLWARLAEALLGARLPARQTRPQDAAPLASPAEPQPA